MWSGFQAVAAVRPRCWHEVGYRRPCGRQPPPDSGCAGWQLAPRGPIGAAGVGACPRPRAWFWRSNAGSDCLAGFVVAVLLAVTPILGFDMCTVGLRVTEASAF